TAGFGRPFYMFETRQISYIINNYLTNFATPRLVLEDINGEEVTMNIADFDGYAIGDLEVTEAVMLAWLGDAANLAGDVYVDVTEGNELVVDATYAAVLDE